jgi:SAM-dependent methyltransferase
MGMYGERLRDLFPGLDPVVEDLFLLESLQVGTLLERASPADLAPVLHAHPAVRRYLVQRRPEAAQAIDGLLARHPPMAGAELEAAAARLLWEIGDEIVYQRMPDAYDEVARRDWDATALLGAVRLDRRTVIDAGAGTGLVAFSALAHGAGTVFAVEPVARLRAWMREKADHAGVTGLYVLDGTLDRIPLPPASADALITNRAFGWRLEAESAEIARVVRPGGTSVHLTGMPYPPLDGEPLHRSMLEAGYTLDAYVAGGRELRLYHRTECPPPALPGLSLAQTRPAHRP